MTKYLLYILVNFKTDYYLEMFKLFLKSVVTFGNVSALDLLIICDNGTHDKINSLRSISSNLKQFSNVFFHHIPKDNNLQHALMRKFSVIEFEGYMNYQKIMYLDIDVLVRDDIIKVFDKVPVRNNTLYATKEGEIDEKYWYLNTYKNSNIQKLKADGVKGFNTGLFMFKPSEAMKTHFQNVRDLAANYTGKYSFYDQSFANYYFNINKLVNTRYMNDIYVMFPNEEQDYPDKIILHFAGIGRYTEKAAIMKKYLAKISNWHK